MSKVIVFQGDSITDAGRGGDLKNDNSRGYATLVKAHLGFEAPGEYEFHNRGVSGNRIADVYARITKDILNLKPDYMSLLIGVNDIWHGLDHTNGTGEKRFEKIYNCLLDELKEELPDLKLILLEPFVLKGTATDNREDQPHRWEEFRLGVVRMARIVRKIAHERGLEFVELQFNFDQAVKKAPAEYWLCDGVHPTAMGDELIKREWLKAFERIK